MTEAEWNGRNKWSDFPYVAVIAATETAGKHRARQMPAPGNCWQKQRVFITDIKRVDPPKPEPEKPDCDLPPPPPPPETPRPVRTAPERTAFDDMRDALKNGVKVVAVPQLFPTSADRAKRMVDIADIRPGDRVLEPEAGTGAILAAIGARHKRSEQPPVETVAVEINPTLAGGLKPSAGTVMCADFLELQPTLGLFDKVLMNPPFAKGDDVRHVMHATKFVKPGGRLVAIMSAGVTFRSDRNTSDFRRFVEDHGGVIEELPPDTFKESGTGVNTVLVTLDF
jgi:predicted RNA methylase